MLPPGEHNKLKKLLSRAGYGPVEQCWIQNLRMEGMGNRIAKCIET